MAWSKRLLVSMAFDDLALAGYVFDLTPEEMQAAVLRMDAMMALWGIKGVRIGYNATLNPDSADLDQDSGIPDWANEAVYKGLATRTATSFGKAIAPSLAVAAKQAYDAMAGFIAANPPQMQLRGNLPAGAGWKLQNNVRGPFIQPPVDRLTAGPDSTLDFNGEVPA